MNYKELEKLLSKNHKFILMGSELYLARHIIKMLKDSLSPEFAVFNYIEIDQSKEGYRETAGKIEAVPMMDNKKIVHIRNFNFALDSNPWSKGEVDNFYQMVDALSADTILILSNESSSNFGNLKLAKDLQKKMQLIKLDRLKENELSEFIKMFLDKQLGKHSIQNSGIASLVRFSGYTDKNSTLNLFDVEGMLLKVTAYYREKGKFGFQEASELFEPKEDGDIFKLMDAVLNNNKNEGWKHFHGLEQRGEPHIKIMVTLAKSFCDMVRFSYYDEEGYSEQDIANVLNKKLYPVEKGLRAARKLGRKKLIRLADAIVDVDYGVKTGRLVESAYGDIAMVKMFEIMEEQELDLKKL